MGAEAEGVAGGDVGGEVVDVEGLLGDELVFVDGVVVDFGVGFYGIYLVGEDGAVEEGELRVGLEDPWAVDGVGVGEEDEVVSVVGELADVFPHGEVGGEDVAPCVVELVMGGV